MSSTFAVGGLASGLDTKSIIDQLMALERRPLDKLQAKRTAHGSRMSAMQSLKDLISSLQGAVKGLTDRSKVNAKSATTDTPSTSPTVLTASATADAINGTYKVTVKQLATSTRITSTGALGNGINANVALKDAGFRNTVVPGTFRINNQAITVTETMTLNDLVTAINNSGAGVTATLIADADGRADNLIKLETAPGQQLQLGSLTDTSNALRLLNLSDAVVTGSLATGFSVTSSTGLAGTNIGASLANARLQSPIDFNTPATVTGIASVDPGVLNTSITVNGVTTTINQTDAGFTPAQNAAFIAKAINDNVNNTVSATANSDGSITLSQKTAGTAPVIDITDAGTGTGLVVGVTQNGTENNATGTGKFKINNVEITYKDTDSITTIINRINSSSAGVTAFYDPIQDRLRLTASQTGARSMTIEESQGTFLASMGLLGASQMYGQNAIFTIEGVNGDADLSSSTNTVTGYIPGVTLTLKETSVTPVTVTVSQDPKATTDTIKAFVNQFNAVLQKIEDQTKYNATTKEASIFTGESAVIGIQRQLRQMVGSAAIGATGAYRNLASIGISFGAVGSAAGSTNRLVIDEAKLSQALADNPQAVEAVLAGFAASTGAPTGNNITGISGTPPVHQDGTYTIKVTDAVTGAFEASFVTTSGQKIWTNTGTLKAGEDNYSVIPGLKLTIAGSLDTIDTTFTVSVTNRGIGVTLNDYLESLTNRDGYFADRKTSDEAISKSFSDRIAAMQDRLDRKQASLEKKYAALEVTMSKLQNQSNALVSQLAKLNASTSQQ